MKRSVTKDACRRAGFCFPSDLIMAGLAGIGVGGAVGGVTGALIGLGIPEYEAKRYEGRLQKGGILLSVRSNHGGTRRDRSRRSSWRSHRCADRPGNPGV